MVKLALTMSPFDRSGAQPYVAADAKSELGPVERGFRVVSAGSVLGGVPAAFREWRSQTAGARPRMRMPALLGTAALHTLALVLILLIEWSLVAPVPLPAVAVALHFEPAPQPAPSPPRESAAVPAPAAAAASPPEEPPAAPSPPEASEPASPPVALAPSEPPVENQAEAAPPVADGPSPAVAKPPPPKPRAVARTRADPPRRIQHRAPPPASAESAVAAAAPPAPAAPPAAAPAPPLLAVAPIVPPRPIGFAQGNRKPDYPMVARSRGLQGLVLLRVDVAPSGTPIAVTVATSSGHPILDDSAVAAVRTWRFSPATQAGIPVAAFAEVPIEFRMAD